MLSSRLQVLCYRYNVFNMAIILQYGRHRLLLNAFYIEMAAVSQKDELVINLISWSFSMEI